MQKYHPGHKFSSKERTTDVLTEEQVDFESLLLSPLLIKGLTDSGFEKPSPIQLKAIPLGRCGLDLIAQAKSGTGKTCVFSVIALESINTESHAIQVLILAPTREIAVQIKDVVNAIGCHIKGLCCHVFIGGLPLEEDKKALKECHIAVGSPGRIKSLIENSHLRTDSIRMFILDEADKLLDENFQEQINWIYSTLPANKQMMAFSATYPDYLANHLTRYMREPTFVRLNASDPTLQGIKQFYFVVPFHHLPHKVFQEKVDHLLKLLSKIDFHQCLLFSNYQIRAQNLSSTLCAKGWPATFIAGSQTQQKRLKAMEKLKEFKCRILISTDLTARGIDAENVNLVINMDLPRDGETYLHRIGRAGRFGTKGIAVTFVAKGKEEKDLREIEASIGIKMDVLPDYIPKSLMACDSSLNNVPRKDKIEVNVLHKNYGRDCMSGSEKLISTEAQEMVDSSVCNVFSSKETVINSTHDTSDITKINFKEAQTKETTDDIKMESTGDNKIEDNSIVSLGSTNNNLKPIAQDEPRLPSVNEFDNDFEEYLALSTKFENMGLQENGIADCVDINKNLDTLRCQKQETAAATSIACQENVKTVENVIECAYQKGEETCLHQDEDDTCSDYDTDGSSDDDDVADDDGNNNFDSSDDSDESSDNRDDNSGVKSGDHDGIDTKFGNSEIDRYGNDALSKYVQPVLTQNISSENEKSVNDDDEYEGLDDDYNTNIYKNQYNPFFGENNEYTMSGEKYSEHSIYHPQVTTDKSFGYHQIARDSNQATENSISFCCSDIKYNDENGTPSKSLNVRSPDTSLENQQMVNNKLHLASTENSCDGLMYEPGMKPHQQINGVNLGNTIDNNTVYNTMRDWSVEDTPPLSDGKLFTHPPAAYHEWNQREYSAHDVQWSSIWTNAFHSINDTITHYARKNTRF